MRRSAIRGHYPALGVSVLLLVLAVQGAGAQSPSPSTVPPATAGSSAAPVGSITWKIDTKGEDFAMNPIPGGVAQSRDGVVYVAGLVVDKGVPAAAFWLSPNLKRWARSKVHGDPGSGAVAIIANPNVPPPAFIGDPPEDRSGYSAVGVSIKGGTVWSWADERQWVTQTMPGVSFVDITGSDAGLFIVGQRDPGPSGMPTIWFAPDSLSWAATPIASAGQPMSVAISPDETLVVAGTVAAADGTPQTAVWQSTDGTAWTPVASDALAGFASVRALEWTPVGFALAVSEKDDGTGTGAVLVSQDGLVWTRSLDVADGQVTALGIAGTDAIAVGADRTWRSADAMTWQEETVPAFGGYTVTSLTTLSDGRLLAVGRVQGKKGAKIATFVGKPGPVEPPATGSEAGNASPSPEASRAP